MHRVLLALGLLSLVGCSRWTYLDHVPNPQTVQDPYMEVAQLLGRAQRPISVQATAESLQFYGRYGRRTLVYNQMTEIGLLQGRGVFQVDVITGRRAALRPRFYDEATARRLIDVLAALKQRASAPGVFTQRAPANVPPGY
ncbi:MAG: hypothetical protein AAF645_02700 [Myxococcota bacterium]